MSKHLAAHVTVRGDNGQAVSFGPEDDLPRWASELITNPKAWDNSSPVDTPEPQAPTEAPIPPKSGPGSSAKAWATYALAQGFETDSDAKASEIREALAEAGIPVE